MYIPLFTVSLSLSLFLPLLKCRRQSPTPLPPTTTHHHRDVCSLPVERLGFCFCGPEAVRSTRRRKRAEARYINIVHIPIHRDKKRFTCQKKCLKLVQGIVVHKASRIQGVNSLVALPPPSPFPPPNVRRRHDKSKPLRGAPHSHIDIFNIAVVAHMMVSYVPYPQTFSLALWGRSQPQRGVFKNNNERGCMILKYSNSAYAYALCHFPATSPAYLDCCVRLGHGIGIIYITTLLHWKGRVTSRV